MSRKGGGQAMLPNPAVENDLSATSLDKKMSALWNSLLDCLECWYITNAYLTAAEIMVL